MSIREVRRWAIADNAPNNLKSLKATAHPRSGAFLTAVKNLRDSGKNRKLSGSPGADELLIFALSRMEHRRRFKTRRSLMAAAFAEIRAAFRAASRKDDTPVVKGLGSGFALDR